MDTIGHYELIFQIFAFVFGAVVGSFLNVCIYRLPRELSVNYPRRSFCPACNQQIPWHQNLPLLSWLWLRGRCAHCGVRIAFRYFLVELLTALLFLAAWVAFPWPIAIAYWVLIALLVSATFIDFEHFIIPDEITIGGMVTGVILSTVVPTLHATTNRAAALRQSLIGVLVGGGIVYGILRLGKVLFGRQRFVLDPSSRVVFTESTLVLPAQEIPYEEIFYRKSDAIELKATRVELIDRCYAEADVRLTPAFLDISGDRFEPESIPQFEVVTDELVVPREAMGLGDVKFMGAIGAFLGWPAVLFSLMLSAVLGSVVGVTLIAIHRRAWSSRIPYGPYIALAAMIWMFGGKRLVEWWWMGM